jgi:ATP-dependent Clp protease ATP-binding subunit ClpA
MFERLTTSARSVLTDAHQAARELGAAAVGPGHLLLGLAQTPGSAADVLAEAGVETGVICAALLPTTPRLADLTDEDAAALATVGIDLAEVLRRLDDAIPERVPAVRRRRRLRLSPDTRRCLHLAVRESMWLKARQIGTEHVLLGLLRADDAWVRGLLDRVGSSADQLRVATLARLDEAA